MLRLISDAHNLHLVEGELEDISEFVHSECDNNNGSISSISSNDSLVGLSWLISDAHAIVAAVVNILSMAVHSGDENLASKSAFWSFLIAAIYTAFDAFVLAVMTKKDVFNSINKSTEL